MSRPSRDWWRPGTTGLIGVDHASRIAARWVAAGAADATTPNWRQVAGTMVLADVSGFTRLTERLTDTGREGSEVLHGVMTTCFGTLLASSIRLGGDIIGFAGDSAMVWFDAEHIDDHVQRGVAAAAHMSPDLAGLSAATTGGRRLKVSVGVHTGVWDAALVGRDVRRMVWCGPQVSTLVALEAAAGAGEVAISPAVAEALPARSAGADLGPGVRLRRAGLVVPPPHRPVTPVDPGTPMAHPDLAALLTLDGEVVVGEHRTVAVGFVRLDGIDQRLRTDGPAAVAADLAGAFDAIDRIAGDGAVTVFDTDVGVDSVKVMVAAGAPRASEHDDDRLVVALRRMVDECSWPVSVGAQRGRVFAARLGVPGRRSYTLMGDVVNVAARAMSLATTGTMVVADGLRVAERPWVTSVALGPQHLKNRNRPVPMWRVDAASPPRRWVRRTSDVVRLARHVEGQRAALFAKRAVDGESGVVSVVGEAGMGVSELLADMVELASPSSTSVAVDPSRQHLAFAGVQAVVDALVDMLVDTPVDPWSWLFSFVPALPDEQRRWADEAFASVTQGAATPAVDPMSSFRRTGVLLAALLLEAMPTPWLLAIDDAHALDDASARVLAIVAETMADTAAGSNRGPMLVFGRHPRVPDDPSPLPWGRRVDLLALTDDVAQELIESIAPQLRQDRVLRIVAAASGNPLVIGELVHRPVTDDGPLPESLNGLAAALIDGLSPRMRIAVRDASVVGVAVPLSLMGPVLQRPDLATVDAWREATPVVRVVDAHTVAFQHEAYRQVAYDRLPFQRRRDLHGRLADHLMSDDGRDQRIATDALVALHLYEAGRWDEAYPMACVVGRTARSSGAIPEAIEFLRLAGTMAHRVDGRQVAALALDEGQARLWIGDLDGAERCYRVAGRSPLDSATRCRLCHVRADLALTQGRLDSARRWIRRGLESADSAADVPQRLVMHLQLDEASRCDIAGRHRTAVDLAADVAQRAGRLGERDLEGLAHLYAEMACSALLDPAAVDHGDRALSIFREIGHDRYLDSALTNTALTMMYLGRWDLAMERYHQAAAHARLTGHILHLGLINANLGFLLYRMGRLDEAEVAGRRAVRLLDASNVPLLAGLPRILLALLAATDDRFEEAHRWVGEARVAFTAANDAPMELDCDATTMALLLREGRHAEVVELGRVLTARLLTRVDQVEPEVMVTVGRVLGCAEMAAGVHGAGEGLQRVTDALLAARRDSLLYEVYRCVEVLARLGGDASAAVERDELAASLGMVVGPERRP